MPCKKSSGGTKLLSIKIKLDALAENLMTMIECELHVENSSSIKLISSGRVLDPLKSLTDQNVKNFQQILAVETNEEESKIEDKSYNRIAKIRKDAEILLKKNGSDYFKVFLFYNIYNCNLSNFSTFKISSKIRMDKQCICPKMNVSQ